MTLHFGAPQIIWAGLGVVNLMLTAALHGKPKTGKHNAAITAVAMVVEFGVLYWGGFFGR